MGKYPDYKVSWENDWTEQHVLPPEMPPGSRLINRVDGDYDVQASAVTERGLYTVVVGVRLREEVEGSEDAPAVRLPTLEEVFSAIDMLVPSGHVMVFMIASNDQRRAAYNAVDKPVPRVVVLGELMPTMATPDVHSIKVGGQPN